MSKRAKKRQPTQVPPEWVDLFEEHDRELTRVRMLWRRGGGRYRPIVPVNLALEELETADFEEWEDLELDETHFDWAIGDGEAPDEAQRRVNAQAKDLWAVAVAWTRAKGPVCDFQLRGYGGEEEILFEDGKRCNLSGERSRYDDDERERPNLDETMRSLINDERIAWRQMDGTKDDFIGRLVDERRSLFDSLDRATTSAPELIDRIGKVLDRALEFQQRQVEEYVSRVSGQRELEAYAYAEHQKTKRNRQFWDFMKEAFHSVKAAVPVVQTLVEEATGYAPQSLPKFKTTQQAFAYLALTTRIDQLLPCFAGDDDQRKAAAEQVLQFFEALSRHPNEAVVIQEAEALVPIVLANPTFVELCTPLQSIAANFIIGRVAVMRAAKQATE